MQATGRAVRPVAIPEQQAVLKARLHRTDAHEHLRSGRPADSRSIRSGPRRSKPTCAYYSEVFTDGQYRLRHPAGAVRAIRTKLRQLARSSSGPPGRPRTNRPGDEISYTNNWPHEPLVDNRPTGDAVIWTGVSIIMLLAGIAGMVWWYASRPDGTATCDDVPATDPLLQAAADPFAEGDAEVLLGRLRADPRADARGHHHGPLRRRRGRVLRHPAGQVAALRGHPHLARAARDLLDRHRVAGGRTVHRPAVSGGSRNGSASASTSCSARSW